MSYKSKSPGDPFSMFSLHFFKLIIFKTDYYTLNWKGFYSGSIIM